MLETKIQNLIQEYRSHCLIGAMAVGVTDRERMICSCCFGKERYGEESNAVSKNTLFRIASISKIVTGMTAYKLIQDGLIDADKNVSYYVPWLSEKNGNMTMKKLLSHTAGLPAEYTPNGPRDENLLEQSLIDEFSKIDVCSLKEKNEYLYSNLGIRLASLVMEKVTGERFSELAKKTVIFPLGMNSTTYKLDEALKKPLCFPCDIEDGKLILVKEHWENAVRYSAGGLFSNVTDLCVLARFILNERTDKKEEILSESTFCEMKKKFAKDEQGDFYGQTIMLKKVDGLTLIGHLGSAPPYATALFVDELSGYGVTILMNTYQKSLRMELTAKIFDLLRK